MIVPAHPKEDVNTSRADKEKKVMKEEKNRNSLYHEGRDIVLELGVDAE